MINRFSVFQFSVACTNRTIFLIDEILGVLKFGSIKIRLAKK